MANQQHIEWLLEGVRAWNVRRQSYEFIPDFEGVIFTELLKDTPLLTGFGYIQFREINLSSANLGGVGLVDADLSRANLRDAILPHANLGGSKLEGANFRNANLTKAKLWKSGLEAAKFERAILYDARLFDARMDYADLEGADLRLANFEGARLHQANLRNTRLEGAKFFMAKLDGADLRNTNLKDSLFRETTLKGAQLENTDVTHAILEDADVRTTYSFSDRNNSFTSIRTDLSVVSGLTQEQLGTMEGDRGVILPEGLVYPPNWPEPIQVTENEDTRSSSSAEERPFVFLSYSSQDRKNVATIHEFLIDQMINVWWDQDIPAGGKWRQIIAEHLESASAVLTMWTKNSTQSDPVIEEAANAQKMRKLVHARLDNSPLPYGFTETQFTEIGDWDGTPSHPGMAKLLQALRDKLDPPTSSEQASRLAHASPVTFKPKDGRLAAADTPPNTRPAIENPADLADRLTAIFHRAATLASRLTEHHIYQVPLDLPIRLGELAALGDGPQPTWYALDDARMSVMDCMVLDQGRDAWNEGLVHDLDRLSERVDEIELLLRPEQIPPGKPGAKPVVVEPDLAGVDDEELRDIESETAQILESPEAAEVLDPSGIDALTRELKHLSDGLQPLADQNRKHGWIRRGLVGIGMAAAAYVAVVSQGMVINVLTAPDAAVTLSARLKQVLDAILKLFT